MKTKMALCVMVGLFINHFSYSQNLPPIMEYQNVKGDYGSIIQVPYKRYKRDANGEYHGKYIEYAKTGEIIKDFNFSHGKKNGLCIYNGGWYLGTSKNYYKYGVPTGTWTNSSAKGYEVRKHTANGIIINPVKVYFSSKKVSVSGLKEFTSEGKLKKLTMFYKSGVTKSETNYNNGNFHGKDIVISP